MVGVPASAVTFIAAFCYFIMSVFVTADWGPINNSFTANSANSDAILGGNAQENLLRHRVITESDGKEFDVMVPFTNTNPRSYLWVSPNGNDGNSGSSSSPLKTIQAAVNKATAGTAVMVKAGTYNETVWINKSGASDAPIWIQSADGRGAAKVVSTGESGFAASGQENLVIKDFAISAGNTGIHMGLGRDWSDLVRNVVVQGNIIDGADTHGIKITQAENAHVIHNVVRNSGQQGIEFVAANNSQISFNEVARAGGPAGIFAKGGSTTVKIQGNHVHDVAQDGIIIGGWTEPQYMRPGFTNYEARYVQVVGNKVENVGKRPLSVMAGWDSSATGNYLDSNPNVDAVVYVEGSPRQDPPLVSKNISITNNVTDRSTNLTKIQPGNDSGFSFTNNSYDGNWSGSVGPFSGSTSSPAPAPAPEPAPAPTPISTTPTPTPVEPAKIDPGSLQFNDPSWWKLNGSPTKYKSGTSGEDRLVGSTANDWLNGKGGADTLIGGKGDDIYIVDNRYDKIVEYAGEGVDLVELWATNFTLPSNVDTLVVKTGQGARATGNDGANIIQGGGGNDVITGRGGKDLLAGGNGADRFVFQKLSDKGDVIVDYKKSQGDVIDLRQLTASLSGEKVSVIDKDGGAAVVVSHNGVNHAMVLVRNIDADELTFGNYLLI